MIISHQSISFETLKESHIDLVRNWRNSPAIRERMVAREIITPEQQQEWFQNLKAQNRLYFLCRNEGKPVGVVHADNVDWQNGISLNSGIFIADPQLHGSGLPIKIAMLFTQSGFAFGIRENRIIIRNDNANAIAFNQMLGYEKTASEKDFSRYRMTRESYAEKTQFVPKALKIDCATLIWENEPIDNFLKDKHDSELDFFTVG